MEITVCNLCGDIIGCLDTPKYRIYKRIEVSDGTKFREIDICNKCQSKLITEIDKEQILNTWKAEKVREYFANEIETEIPYASE